MTARTAAEHAAMAHRHNAEAGATGREGLGNYQRAHADAANAHMLAAAAIDRYGPAAAASVVASDAANYATDEQAPPLPPA